jgi:TetR/AcrR family transcriptional regulator, tetracycline repressor protein
MRYDVDRIARAALDLLDDVGLDGLTTRRLADELGIQGPALYHHFKNKAELLGHMATTIMRQSLATMTDRGDWRQWLLDHALATRKTLLCYRDGAQIIAASEPTKAMKQEIMPAVTKPLIDAGFAQIDAYETVSLLAAFTLGFVIDEQNEIMRSYISTLIDMDRCYLHGVEALIAGVEKKYGSRIKTPRSRLRAVAGRRAR